MELRSFYLIPCRLCERMSSLMNRTISAQTRRPYHDYAMETIVRFRVPLFIAALILVGGCADLRLPDPAVVYVAFGDSSTAGPSERDYPDILRELLGEPRETFANEGESGESAAEGLDRLEMLIVNEIYPNAEVLLYWQGGNDITEFIREFDLLLLFSPDEPGYPFAEALIRQLDETQEDIESVIEAAQDVGLDVFVATYYFVQEDFGICDAFPLDLVLPEQARKANEYLLRLNERIRAAAANSGATLVDVASLDETIRADSANYFDCNHLSEQGNAIVADLFSDTILASRD